MTLHRLAKYITFVEEHSWYACQIASALHFVQHSSASNPIAEGLTCHVVRLVFMELQNSTLRTSSTACLWVIAQTVTAHVTAALDSTLERGTQVITAPSQRQTSNKGISPSHPSKNVSWRAHKSDVRAHLLTLAPSSRELGEYGRNTPPRNRDRDGRKANPRDRRPTHLMALVTLMIRSSWATRMEKVSTES